MMTYTNVLCKGEPGYRYSLEIPGRKALFVIGVNPSTADSSTSDPTMDSILRFINGSQSGFDALVMLNVSPQRATNPGDMNRVQDEEKFNKSLEVIKSLCSRYPDAPVLLAYGNNIGTKTYLRNNLKQIYSILKGNREWLHIGGTNGLTKQGHPRHPLYVSHKVGLVPFKNIEAYICSL